MKQYIMLGVIAAGIIMLAVFLFLSLRTKGEKKKKPEKSLFSELEENPRIFSEDYRTEILTEREYGFDDKSVEEEKAEERAEQAAASEAAYGLESELKLKTAAERVHEEYSLENCRIKSLRVGEKLIKKISLKSCSIDNLVLMPQDESESEDSL